MFSALQPKSTMRSNDKIREAATRHFDALIDLARRVERDVAEAERDKVLGLRIVEAGLQLSAGDVLVLSEVLPTDVEQREGYRQSMRVMPYLCGALRLFDLEFAHATIGVVPHGAVRALMESEAPVDHEGVSLTRENVFVQYRRMDAI